MRYIFIYFSIFLLSSYSHAIKLENLKVRPALKTNYLTSFYLKIENNSDKLDYLLSVKIIDHPNSLVQIRKTVIEKNIVRIIKIDRLIIPAHSTVTLDPIGIYLVATGPLYFKTKPLKLEFSFENAGKIIIETNE